MRDMPAVTAGLNPVTAESRIHAVQAACWVFTEGSAESVMSAHVQGRLKRISYWPAVIDGFLADTGLTMEPPQPASKICGVVSQLPGKAVVLS
jgi:hypothetical protein